MAVVVVDRRRIVFGVFGREAEGIDLGGSAAGENQRAERSIFVMRGDVIVDCDDLGDILVTVVRVVRGGIAAMPRERTRRDGLRRIPDVGIASVVCNLQIAVIEEALGVLGMSAALAVVAHRDDGIALRPTHRTVLAIVGDAPEAGLGCDEGLVAVIVVSERFGRLGDVDLVGCSGNKVFALIAVRGGLGERCVGFEIGEASGRGVVKEVTAKVVGTETEGRALVDRDGRIRVRFAANRRVTGGGTHCVLVQVIRLIGRGLRLALLVIGRRTAAVADRIVIEVLGEARDRLAILRATGRSQLASGVVRVAVDRSGEIAEGGAGFGDGCAAPGGIVGVVELRDDVSGRRVTDLKELVIRVVGPGGR